MLALPTAGLVRDFCNLDGTSSRESFICRCYILSYNLITKSNILMQTKDYADKHIIYDVLEKKFEVALVEELPLLIYNVNLEGTDFHSVLDILIENKSLNLTQLLVNLALSQDKTGFLYEALTHYMEKLNFSMQGVKIYLQR